MLSTMFARRLAARNVHYGWAVAGTTFLTMLVVAGAVGAPGVFIVPLQKEFGWSAADIPARWRSVSCCSAAWGRLRPPS